MNDRNPPIPWRGIVRGVAVVYGVTFVSGLVFAFNGITPQTDHVAYPLLALLTGAVGVAIALRIAQTTRPWYVLAIGLGVWVLSSTGVLLGAQSFTGWVSSSAFIGTTLILGRFLAGTSRKSLPASASCYSTLAQRATQPRRNA